MIIRELRSGCGDATVTLTYDEIVKLDAVLYDATKISKEIAKPNTILQDTTETSEDKYKGLAKEFARLHCLVKEGCLDFESQCVS